MKPLSIQKLAEVIKAKNPPDSKEIIENVSIDSRKISQNCVFFAIKGTHNDGHNFITQAFENGAVCAVVKRSVSIPDNKPLLIVDDTTQALGELAKFVRADSSYKVIAVTGSVGKTTTKNIIHHILAKKYKCFVSPKSYNNQIGVPLTVFDAPDDCDFVVAELGTNHPGEIKYLSDIIQPDIAVITAICPAHLEGFGSIDGIIKEKVSIISGLKKGGKFFINGNKAQLVNYCLQNHISFTTFGTEQVCDVRIKHIELFGDRSKFTIEGVKVDLPLAGSGNVENAAAAWAVCSHLGISASEFAHFIADIKPVDMRLEIIELGRITVINDCYNANPGSMENALQTLYLLALQKKRRPVFVFGKMGELGTESAKFHTELGRTITHYRIPLVLTTQGDSALAAQAAQKQATYPIMVKIFENVDDLANNLHKFVSPDDIILVKASRSERFEIVVECLKSYLTGT